MLLQSIAETIVVRWLEAQYLEDVARAPGNSAGSGVDIVYTASGESRRIKVKADPYFGTDASKISDRSRVFYRQTTGNLALEAVADSATRAPGWALGCDADEVFYYYLALPQSEEELGTLVAEGTEALLAGLRVDGDELLILPMAPTASWFAKNIDRYTPRPVTTGSGSGWYRLVPRSDVSSAVPGVRVVGPIFDGARR